MDANVRATLEGNGFDVDGTLKRFLNNEALYTKCMKKFLDDKSYGELQEAFKAGNCDGAFKAAHTMKGFVSNLGINEMYHLLIPMVEKLRAGNMDVAPEMEQLDGLYSKTRKIIEEL